MTVPAPPLGQPLKWLGGKIDIRVELDTGLAGSAFAIWDVGEWDVSTWGSIDPDWTDISPYVEAVHVARGRERWHQRFAAGNASIALDNTSGVFTPEAGGASHWHLPFRPGRRIRIVAVPTPGLKVPLFTGTIDASDDNLAAAAFDITAKVRAVDFMATWAGNDPLALETPTGVQRTDRRVHAALDRLGWPNGRRRIQTGTVNMQSSFLAQSTAEEAHRAAEAEGGDFFCDAAGDAVFMAREWLSGGAANMLTFADAVERDGPAAYWRFEGAGTADETGNGHTLTLVGSPATAQPGVVAGDEAVVFNGSTQHATVASDAALNFTGDVTIEVWALAHAAGSGGARHIIECAGGIGTNAVRWVIGLDPVDALFVGPTTDNNLAFTGATVPADEWVHLALVINYVGAADRRLRAFIAGELVYDQTFAHRPSDAVARNTVIARDARFALNFFDGEISEAAIYARALDPADIAAHAEAPWLDEYTRSIEVQGYLGRDEVPAGAQSAHVEAVGTSWETARIRNDVQFARVGGTVQRATDAASEVAYGVRGYRRLDHYNNSDADVAALADRFLAAYKDDRLRVDSVTIAANDDPADDDLNRLFWDARLGDLLDVRVATPYGWEYSKLVHINAIEHDITPSGWVVRFTLDDAQTWVPAT